MKKGQYVYVSIYGRMQRVLILAVRHGGTIDVQTSIGHCYRVSGLYFNNLQLSTRLVRVFLLLLHWCGLSRPGFALPVAGKRLPMLCFLRDCIG